MEGPGEQRLGGKTSGRPTGFDDPEISIEFQFIFNDAL